MTTANDLVTRAYQALYSTSQTPADEDASKGLELLNEMLHSWELNYGVDLGHADLVLTDTMTLPDSHFAAVRYNLMLTWGVDASVPARPEVALFAERGLRSLQDAYSDLPELTFDTGLRNRVNRTNESFDG